MVFESATHLAVYTTIPRTGICKVDNDVGQSVGQYQLLQGLYNGLCVSQCELIFLSTFYVLCSSQVCFDCANVAMNGK